MNLPVPTHDLFAWHRALREANTRDDDGVPVVEAVLSRQALALAFVLGTFMDSDGTTPARWSPGLDRLSNALGYPVSDHRKAVGRLLDELQEAGYLIVTSRRGRFTPNLYTATVPVHRVATPDADDDRQEPGGPVEQPRPSSPETAPGAAATPRNETLRAALATLNNAFSAACAPANSGTGAAQPSQSFSTPFPTGGGQPGPGPGAGGARPAGEPRPEDRPDTTATQRLLQTALAGMHRHPAAANELMTAVARLPNRFELDEQVNALCALGAADKVVTALARPYDKARKPAVVAAARVRVLHAAYGRPATP